MLKRGDLGLAALAAARSMRAALASGDLVAVAVSARARSTGCSALTTAACSRPSRLPRQPWQSA